MTHLSDLDKWKADAAHKFFAGPTCSLQFGTRRSLRKYIEKQGYSRQEADRIATEMGFPKGAK